MRILAIDSAVGRSSATLVTDGVCVAGLQQDLERDHAAVLPVMVRDVLRTAGLVASELDAIAVTVGPGSFTGIRAGLALAQGLGLASGCPVVGVNVFEALLEPVALPEDRVPWCVIPSRRGRVFLGMGQQVLSVAVADMPMPEQPIALAGPASLEVAAQLATRGADTVLTASILPSGHAIAAVAQKRLRGHLPALAAEPLYIDLPEATPRIRTDAA